MRITYRYRCRRDRGDHGLPNIVNLPHHYGIPLPFLTATLYPNHIVVVYKELKKKASCSLFDSFLDKPYVPAKELLISQESFWSSLLFQANLHTNSL